MRVQVICAYGPYRRGVEINPPDGLGNLLIRRGLVAAISEERAASESASAETADELPEVVTYCSVDGDPHLGNPAPRPKPPPRRK